MSGNLSSIHRLVAATVLVSAGFFPLASQANDYSVCPDWGIVTITSLPNSSPVFYEATTEGGITWSGTMAAGDNKTQALMEVVIKNITPAPLPNHPYEAHTGVPACRYILRYGAILELTIKGLPNFLATPLKGNSIHFNWMVPTDPANSLSCPGPITDGSPTILGNYCPMILTQQTVPTTDTTVINPLLTDPPPQAVQ